MSVEAGLGGYLADPFLARLYQAIRDAGPIRAISVDLTHRCNIRCRGCYFFGEELERSERPAEEAVFDRFVARELARGTNFVTVVGGEPTLELERLRKLHGAFRVNVASNGLVPIPRAGFENLPIGISVWGDQTSDPELRGGSGSRVFERALANYRDDPRAFWYYTVAAGRAHEIEGCVERCVDNGNYVLFNLYGDHDGLGGELDHRTGFAAVARQIERMIERYPERILSTRYLTQVMTSGELYGDRWGYDVCTSVTADHPINAARVASGKPYNRHFRAYNADLESTRRCCTGHERDCSSCYDVWQRFSWIMLDMRRHLGSREELERWLTTTYLFYGLNRFVDWPTFVADLPAIHRRLA